MSRSLAPLLPVRHQLPGLHFVHDVIGPCLHALFVREQVSSASSERSIIIKDIDTWQNRTGHVYTWSNA